MSGWHDARRTDSNRSLLTVTSRPKDRSMKADDGGHHEDWMWSKEMAVASKTGTLSRVWTLQEEFGRKESALPPWTPVLV